MELNGLVHIYCGDGKGKTTAAIGLMIRAAGSGKKILFYQFMKDNTSNELNVLSEVDNITRIPGPDKVKFSFQMDPEEKKEERVCNDNMLKEVLKRSGDYDMLVLDEIIYTIQNGLADETIVIDFLKNKPQHLEVVMTGQHPSEELKMYADYISDINKIKHPYDQGIQSRPGIEK